MTADNIYLRLAEHLSCLEMGYPVTEDLVDILKEVFSPIEAEMALAIPTQTIPLEPVGVDEIAKGTGVTRETLVEVLETLDRKGLLYSAITEHGERRDHFFCKQNPTNEEKTGCVELIEVVPECPQGKMLACQIRDKY